MLPNARGQYFLDDARLRSSRLVDGMCHECMNGVLTKTWISGVRGSFCFNETNAMGLQSYVKKGISRSVSHPTIVYYTTSERIHVVHDALQDTHPLCDPNHGTE